MATALLFRYPSIMDVPSGLVRLVSAIVAYVVSWTLAIVATCKFMASVAVLIGALTLTVMYPGWIVCAFVLVCVAVVSKPR